MLVTNIKPDHKDLILRKIENVNSELSECENPELVASISVGVAFGNENIAMREVFKKADDALYDVKQNGRSACKIAD